MVGSLVGKCSSKTNSSDGAVFPRASVVQRFDLSEGSKLPFTFYEQLQKGSVIRHMTSVLQPILEKGILDHSIIHWALVEYLTIADKVPQKP
ncbi:hypothetical protein KY290_006607 [Solanum tuberosum]|uniref:Uncharacterized protein n=1 Tax=Solanum tuberosum TaxID=4113 RepID=A0ABQ7WJK1_SOLTU|nr:hypothetical protein KY290_006607 [Solanum tuberosum]